MTPQRFDKQRDYVLIFTPEAGIQPHYVAQCIIAATLKERGFKVLMAYCRSLLARCPFMDMTQAPFGNEPASVDVKLARCGECINKATALLNYYGLEAVDLGSLFTPQINNTIAEAIRRAPLDLREFEFDSLKFGKLSARDVVFATKQYEFENISPSTRLAWLDYLKSALTTYLTVKRLCESISIGKLLYFNEYSSNLGALLAARQAGIPILSVTMAPHKGVDRTRFVMMDEPFPLAHRRLIKEWHNWREVPLRASDMQIIADDIIYRLGGASLHIYSPPKTSKAVELYDRLALSPQKKLLAAFTSSKDEMSAYQMTMEGLGVPFTPPSWPFNDQIEWLQALTAYVEGRSDLQLVVRVHPREGKNKRESFGSQHLQSLLLVFKRPFSNCRFVWPEDDVSSYDLMELADLGLTSWSTIGLEMARLGIPVLTAFGAYSFPDDDFLKFGGPGRQDFFQQLETMLAGTSSIDTILRAFRCYYAFHLSFSVDMSDIVPACDFNGVPQYKTPQAADIIESVAIAGNSLSRLNREFLCRSGSAESTAQKALLTQQIIRLLHFFYLGEDNWKGRMLRTIEGPLSPLQIKQLQEQSVHSETVSLVLDGNMTYYLAAGRKVERFSPMLARLARLVRSELPGKYQGF